MQKKKDLVKIKKEQGLMQKILLFVSQKKGFVFAIIITLLAILIILINTFYPNNLAEKNVFANELFVQNQATFQAYQVDIEEQLTYEFETTLDDDYLYSIRDDLDWMIAKEKELYYSKPSNEVYLKEVAFTLASQKLIEINESFSFEIGEPNYEEKINNALTKEIIIPVLFTAAELDEGFETTWEKERFLFYSKQIFEDYIKEKKLLIQNTDSIERKYVESKKLLLLSYFEE